MSEAAVRAELQITLKDNATTGLKAVEQAAVNAAHKTAAASVEAAGKSVAAAKNAASKMESAHDQVAAKFVMSQKQMTASAIAERKRIDAARAASDAKQAAYEKSAAGRYAKNMEDRSTLGIRSENSIQKEIRETEGAYKRLASSGVLSARELARAQDASIAKVKVLRRELDGVEKASRITPGAVAAVGGAYMLAKPAVTRAMDYDANVADITNSLFSDRDAEGRIAGKAEVKAAISAALKKGGGSREQASETLAQLVSSGEFSQAGAFSMLGDLQKAGTASRADPKELAQIALAAKRMGIDESQIGTVISKAIRAGQMGGFELKDMSRWLPQVLSQAKSLGVTGMDGSERVLMSMQASVTTAGTKDEAGNNLANLLAKLSAPETITDFKKKYGIDIQDRMAKGRLAGVDQITSFATAMDEVVAKDPKIKALDAELAGLQKKAATSKGADREAALKSIRAIYEMGAIGSILKDRQALMGFLAERNGDELMNRVGAGIRADNGQELDTSFKVMDDTASAQMQRLKNANEEGQDAALTGAGGPLKPLLHGLTAAAEEFPLLTASVTAATGALFLLAGAAGINAALGVGGKAGGWLGKAGAMVGPLATRASAAAAGLFSAPVAVGAGALAGGFALGQTDTAGELVLNIMKLFGSKDAKMALETLKQPEQKPVDVDAKFQFGLPPGMVLQHQSVQSSGGNVQTNTGHFIHGAP